MLKHTIKYTNFDDEETEGVFYFNLTKSEIVRMEFSRAGGLGKMMERIVEDKDALLVLNEFEEIILMSHGQKSDDGSRFIKNDQIREEFKQSAAYDVLFSQMIQDSDFAAHFISQVVPKELAAGITDEKLQELGVKVSAAPNTVETSVVSPPPFPPAPTPTA